MNWREQWHAKALPLRRLISRGAVGERGRRILQCLGASPLGHRWLEWIEKARWQPLRQYVQELPLRRALTQGLRSFRISPFEQQLAIGTIAVAWLIVCGVHLGAQNLVHLTSGWSRQTQAIVYLDDDLAPARARLIADTIQKLPGVVAVHPVERATAFARLRASLGDRADLLAGVEESILPSSMEVSIQGGVAERQRLAPQFERLRHVAGVEDVAMVGDWADRMNALERMVQIGAWLLGLLVAAACLYLMISTIRLRLLARKEEIQILKLVGATDGFVRGPFLVEGALAGLAGAMLGLGVLYLLYRLTAPWIERALGALLSATPLVFLSATDVTIAWVAGGVLGLLGSVVASDRYARV